MRQFTINQRIKSGNRLGTLLSIDPGGSFPYRVRFDDGVTEHVGYDTLREIDHLAWNDHKELENK